jgi:hypothetical protein
MTKGSRGAAEKGPTDSEPYKSRQLLAEKQKLRQALPMNSAPSSGRDREAAVPALLPSGKKREEKFSAVLSA